MTNRHPIGVFDSGLGGLTVLKEIVKELPEYDYLYLGDNARTPYGTRSFETVYEFTLECVTKMFSMGCPLIILACNTASAKALRNIQQKDLERIAPGNRVLGVIRPTAEVADSFTKTKHIGVLATAGTVSSDSYTLELKKNYPEVRVHQEACSIWVPMVEYNEMDTPAADYLIKKHVDALLSKSEKIDTVILGCTHFPLLLPKIQKYIPKGVKIISQGEIVAKSLADYLKRHPEIENRCTRNSSIEFYTTDSPSNFDTAASIFWGEKVSSKKIEV